MERISRVALVLLAAVFTVATVATGAASSDVIFYEPFDDAWESRWVTSENSDYQGSWKHEKSEGHEDFGLLVSEAAKKHGVAVKLPKAVDFKDDVVVFQYDVRLQKGLECGGAYLKFLMPHGEDWTPSEFTNETPYSIMFGPDKCGSTNKVHFIFRHRAPNSDKHIEHHLKHPPTPVGDKLSHVYTAILYKNNTVRILIDGKEEAKADLLSNSFEPAVLPSKTIADPEDKKPEDWDERSKIPDPEASKPEDWDEEAPLEIEDTEAVKPDGWLDDEPDEIDDPEATKPEDWDDEEDGEWEAPHITNPKCEEAPGCGEWKRPSKRNPSYKGKWYAPMIDNPNYKGIWAPRQIPNPDYFELERANVEPISAIGIEIWTMQDGILFDNILVTKDEDVAADYRDKTWKVKYEAEKFKEKAGTSAATSALAVVQGAVIKQLRKLAELPALASKKEKLTEVIDKAEQQSALTFVAVIGSASLTFLVALYKLLLGGKKTTASAPVVAKAIEKEGEDDEVEKKKSEEGEEKREKEEEKEEEEEKEGEEVNEIEEKESSGAARRRTRRDI